MEQDNIQPQMPQAETGTAPVQQETQQPAQMEEAPQAPSVGQVFAEGRDAVLSGGKSLGLSGGQVEDIYQFAGGVVPAEPDPFNDFYAEKSKQQAASQQAISAEDTETPVEEEPSRIEWGGGFSGRVGSKEDYNAIARQMQEDGDVYRKNLIDMYRPGLERTMTPEQIETANLQDIMGAVGEDYDEWRNNYYKMQDIAPRELAEQQGLAGDSVTDAGKNAVAEREQERQRAKEELFDIANIYGPSEASSGLLASFIFDSGPFAGTGFEKGTQRRLLEQAQNERHLELLIDAELNRYANHSQYAEQIDDPSMIDGYSWQYGLAVSASNSATDWAKRSIEFLPEAGAGFYALVGQAAGMDTSMFDDWITDRADMVAQRHYQNSVFENAYTQSAGDGFLSHTAYKGVEIGTMLMLDAATTFLTGKLPIGLIPAAGKSAIKGTARYMGKKGITPRGFFEDTFGKGAVDKFLYGATGKRVATSRAAAGRRIATDAPSVDLGGKFIRDEIGAFANKPVTGFNTFVYRVGAESFTNSYARQLDRAAMQGREVDASDAFFALGDSIAHMTIAHLIGKNIPGVKTFPSKGVGSRGFLNSGPYSTATMMTALQRSGARTMLQGVRSGGDFVAFDLLMDAYSLTDSDDRADVIDRWVNKSGDQMKNLFGSFLIGGVIGGFSLPANFTKEMRAIKDAKTGAEAWSAWSRLSAEQKKAMLDHRSEAFFKGMQEQMSLEKSVVHENQFLFTGISNEKLAEILFYGDKELPDAALMSGDVPGIGYRIKVDGTRVKNAKVRERLVDPNGEIGVTRAMAYAEAQRRGLSLDVAQFGNAEINFLFEGRPAIEARRGKFTKELDVRRRHVLRTPPSPKGVRSVSVEGATSAERSNKIVNFFRTIGLNKEKIRTKPGEFAEKIRRESRLSTDPQAARDVDKALKGVTSIDGIFAAARKSKALNKYLKRVVASERQFTPESASNREILQNIARANPSLLRWVVSQVHRGQNTTSNPALSRRHMERLFPDLSPKSNTKAARHRLADALAHVFQETAGGPLVRTPRYETGPTDVARASYAETAPKFTPSRALGTERIGEYKAGRITSEIEIDGYGRPLDAATSTETTRAAIDRGVPKESLEAQLRGAKPKRPKDETETTTTAQAEQGSPALVGNRLDSGTQKTDPIVEVSRRDTSLTTREAVREEVSRLEDAGATGVEVQFQGEPGSSLMAAVAPQANAANLSVVIATGPGRFTRRVSVSQNGVVTLRSDVSARAARLAIARHVATERWMDSSGFKFGAALMSAFSTHSRVRKIMEAVYGRPFSREEFFEAARRLDEFDRSPDATVTGTPPIFRAALFEIIMPLLTDKQRADIIRTNAKAFSDWYVKQQEVYREFGFENPRKNGDILGGVKATEAMQRVANGEPMKGDILKDGTLASQHIKALNLAFARRELIEPNPDVAVLRRQLDRAETTGEIAPAPEKSNRAEKTEAEVVRDRESIEPIELYNPKTGFNKAAINELESAYPGLMSRVDAAMGSMKSGFETFEHMGKTVEVTGDRGAFSIRVNEPSATDRRGSHSETTMTPEQREVSDKVTELVEKGRESTTVDSKELSAPAGPPTPPAAPPAGAPSGPSGGAPSPAAAPVVAESKGLARRLFDAYLGGIGRFLEDPFTLSIHTGNMPFRNFVENLFVLEQAIRDEQGRDLFALNQAHRALKKDKQSTLLTDREGKRLAEILETPIAEDKVDTHPVTASLRETERNYIKVIRRINEAQRQSLMADKRKAISMAYKYGTVKSNLAEIRAAKPDWSVAMEKVGRKNLYAITTKEGTVRLTRETLPEFMAKELVPESYGYKDSYMPHMFFGSFRGTAVIKDADGNIVDTLKFGVGEKSSRSLERSEILALIEQGIERRRAELPDAEYSFEVNIKEAEGRVSQDALYLPGRLRRNIASAIAKASGAHRSHINAALNGKVESRAVKTAFLPAMMKREGAEGYSTDVHRVMELAIQNFYRNKLSRQIQEQATPIIREMEAPGGAPRWVPEYARRLADHTVFGTRNMERGLHESGLSGMVDFGDRFFGGLRAFQFYRQLVRPGQHIINSTQALQVWSLLGTSEFAGAIKEYNSKAGQDFIKEWGFFDQAGYNPGKFGDSLSAGTGLLLTSIHTAGNKVAGKVWNVNSEQRNQNFAFYALARHAMKNLNMAPKEAAQYGRIWGSLFTQYRFARANDPVMLRGNLMRTLGQFKRFQIQTLGMAMALAQNAKAPGVVPGVGRTSLARFMLLNTVLGGVRGSLVGFGLLATGALGASVYSGIRQMFDDEYLPALPNNPFASQEAAYKWLLESTDGGKFAGAPIAEIAMFGVGRMAGVDMSGNFNLTNLGPGGLGDYFLGPSLGMFSRIYQDAFANRDALARPASVRAIESAIESGAATRSMKALYEFLRFYDELGDMEQAEYESTMLGLFGTGRRRSGTSELIMDRDAFDFFSDIVGLRSADYTAQFMLSNIARVVQETWTDARNRIAAVYNQDPARAERMMADWNNAYGALQPIIFTDIQEMADNAHGRVTLSRDERNKKRLQELPERVQANLSALREAE